MLLVDRKGLPLGYTLVLANEKEYEPVRELALGDGSEILVADKGLWGKQYAQTLELEGVRLHTPDRVRTATTSCVSREWTGKLWGERDGFGFTRKQADAERLVWVERKGYRRPRQVLFADYAAR